MTKLYLIRHGQKEEMRGDPFLTKIGEEQARITAEYLKSSGISAIYTSPMNRTQQTAEIIAEKIGLEIKTDDRLRERVEFDSKSPFETFEDFMKEWIKTDKDRNYVPVYGDSSVNCGQRIKETIEEVVNNNINKTILFVTHGGAIGDFLRTVFDKNSLRYVLNRKYGVEFINILECSITNVVRKDDEYVLKSLSDVSHLITPIL